MDEFRFSNGIARWTSNFIPGTRGLLIAVSKNISSISIENWYHLALVRYNNSFSMYQDGVQIGTSETHADALPDLAGNLKLGAFGANSAEVNQFYGYLDEIRVSKGIARWVSAFTPLTHPYTISDKQFVTNAQKINIINMQNAGLATLVAGTVTISSSIVTANSRIFCTIQSLGTVSTPKEIAVTARVPGTSFTITSADGTDTSLIAWFIIEPGT